MKDKILEIYRLLAEITSHVSEQDAKESIKVGGSDVNTQVEIEVSDDEAMSILLESAQTFMRGGEEVLIAYKVCDDLEYTKFKQGPKYSPDVETTWFLDEKPVLSSEDTRDPVIGCFIPISSITKVNNPSSKTGFLGELDDKGGEHLDQMSINVAPGSFICYKEIKHRLPKSLA